MIEIEVFISIFAPLNEMLGNWAKDFNNPS
jgi:hypothetical protein